MCDFLFQNISNIFHAPTEVIETLQQLEPYKAPKEDLRVKAGTADELDLNENGEVSIPDEQVIGKSKDLFGDKVYGDIDDKLNSVIDSIVSKKPENPERISLPISESCWRQRRRTIGRSRQAELRLRYEGFPTEEGRTQDQGRCE